MKGSKIHTDENGNPIHQLDKQYRGLGMQEMTPCKYTCPPSYLVSDDANGAGIVEVGSSEYEELKDYLVKSHGYTHQYEIPRDCYLNW